MGSGRKKYWSYNAGERGRNWVRAYEDPKSRILLLEWFEVEPEGRRRRKRRSLGHRDREQAKATADEVAAAFARDEPPAPARREGEVTLHELFRRYLAEETPLKGKSKQGHDRRAAAMFLEFFGPRRKAATLNLGDWKRFIRARRTGETGPPGRRKKRAVGDRQVEYDVKFLWSVLNWAGTTGDGEGNLLLPRNPLKKYVRARHWPKEINPARPVLTDEQYRALLPAARSMDWRFEVALVLAHETGHRIRSIRRLRWSDFEVRDDWIRWRDENDKIGWEHRTPLTPEAAAALLKAREHNPAIGDSWVLPSPADPSRPCSRNIMRDWWNAAQERAGLSHIERLGWHSLRRKFANDLRDLPLKDLAALGGWKDTRTILVCYLEEDERAMVEALRNRHRQALRDERADDPD